MWWYGFLLVGSTGDWNWTSASGACRRDKIYRPGELLVLEGEAYVEAGWTRELRAKTSIRCRSTLLDAVAYQDEFGASASDCDSMASEILAPESDADPADVG